MRRGELGSPGLFFQAQIGTVPATGGNLTVVRKLPGECIDPANASCVDPAGGSVAPANTDPSFAVRTLRWGGSSKLPVVLVTGLADSHGGITPGQSCSLAVTGSMTVLCDALENAGFPVYVVSSAAGPGAVIDNRLGFDVNAHSLESYLFTVVKRPALLVGHSMGGIFSRIAISRYGAQEAGLFTIGSPMDGSFGADIAIGAANFPCTPLAACSALRAGGAFALSHFGPAAMQDLLMTSRLADNTTLAPTGVPTWTLAGTACHPFGTTLQSGLLGYTFPNDGIVGLSSAFGVAANLGPTVRSTVNAYHESGLQRLSLLCGPAGIELTDSTMIAQVLAAANTLQALGPAADLPTAAADQPTANAPAARRGLRLVLPLQSGLMGTIKANTPLPIGSGTSLIAGRAFSLSCGRRVLPALPALGGRAFGFPTGTLQCRKAVLRTPRRLSLGVASDPEDAIVTVTRAPHGYTLTISSAKPINALRLSRGKHIVQLHRHRFGVRTVMTTLTAAQASGLIVTATIRTHNYTAMLPTLR